MCLGTGREVGISTQAFSAQLMMMMMIMIFGKRKA